MTEPRPLRQPSDSLPDLGVTATVVMDHHTHGPCQIDPERAFLRQVALRDHDDLYGGEVEDGIDPTHEPLVDDIPIVSFYSFHVALYALQNPTPENIKRALYAIAHSGDCEEHYDHENSTVLPVPAPRDWPVWMPGDEAA